MLGRYELLATIGVGGMASVILARQRGPAGFEKAVVIKLIHPHMAQDSIAVNMLLDEAKIASQLDHQNIVHTYELGEAHGTYYIVMEYLAGESLGQVLKEGQKQRVNLPPYVAAKIVSDAAEGLHYAHDLADFSGAPLGIVHRDVSPGNIVVQYNGAVKVVDFGIAKAQGRVTSTQDGELKGKYGYMSPEQIKNEPMDRRSDIFSLGVVLWESLARRRLFQADNVAAILMQILQGDRTPPSTLDPEVPHALDTIALRALAPDPRDRFQTVAEMKQAIDDAIWRARVGPAEIAAHMHRLFTDRIETRKALLSRATSELLSPGDYEVLGTAFRDPASQPSRPATDPAPAPARDSSSEDMQTVPLAKPAPPAPLLHTPRPQLPLPAPPQPRPQTPVPSWQNLPPPTVQRSSIAGWTQADTGRTLAPAPRPSAPGLEPPKEKNGPVIAILVAGALLGIGLGLFVGLRGGGDDETKPQAAATTEPAADPAPAPAPDPKPAASVPSVSEAMQAPQPTVTPIPPERAPTVAQVNPPAVLPPPVEEKPAPVEDKPAPIEPRPVVKRPAPVVAKPAPPDDGERDKKPAPKGANEGELYKKATDAYLAGDFGVAERTFKAALAQNRGYAPAYRGLGFVYQRQGETTKALQALRTYLKLAPGAADGAAIRKRIQQLGGE
jgi:serine/threonine-protein kinase